MVLGRGVAGPANPQAGGFPAAFRVIEEAVNAAFAGAGLERGEVGAVCLALAGAGRDEDQRRLEEWAASHRLAKKRVLVHDALPVLAEGTPDGWGVAVIAGTGSLAFGRDAAGRTARSGGWGYLFGDEGSGYWIVLAALRAVVSAADGRGPATAMTERVLAALEISQPQQLVPAVYGRNLDRATLAGLAPLVVEAADAGDAVALEIVAAAATSLAQMGASVARQLDLADQPFPLALAGGVLTGSLRLRELMAEQLRSLGLVPQPIHVVIDPALGALKLAAQGAK